MIGMSHVGGNTGCVVACESSWSVLYYQPTWRAYTEVPDKLYSERVTCKRQYACAIHSVEHEAGETVERRER